MTTMGFGLAARLCALLVAALGPLWLLAPATPAQAQPAGPGLEVVPASTAPGERVTLRGSGWPAGVQLVARLSEQSAVGGPTANLAGVFQADASGSFAAQGTIPLTLFGSGSRANLTVVPGDYTIVVSSGPELRASVPFTVGPPREGVLLWGEVILDTNGDDSRDPSDQPAGGLVGVSLSVDRDNGATRQAITDARGRYLFPSLEPGSYSLRSELQRQGVRWAATATGSGADGQAVKLDLLLRESAAPPPPIDPARCFVQTGFCVEREAFWDYFSHRGGVRGLGYPVSRTFLFEGQPTQFFQRLVLQEWPDGSIRSLNLLDPGLMLYTRINGSEFPPVMEDVKAATPPVGSPDYDLRIVEFTRQVAPNVLPSGQRTGFFDAFVGTVTCQDAYPEGSCREDLLPLLNLEIWGAPISRPVPDPNNAGFVYVRFQRGIMHYQGQNPQGEPITEGILLADWFKSLITGRDLPADLEAQAQAAGSRYLRQYCPERPGWLCRPDELPGTDLSRAFATKVAP